MSPRSISRWLAREVDSLQFSNPVTCVYNPLIYARKSHEAYLEQHAKQGLDALFLGMNPGPWGMAQTGGGEVSLYETFLGFMNPSNSLLLFIQDDRSKALHAPEVK